MRGFLQEAGLGRCRSFYGDPHFLLAIAAGILYWLALLLYGVRPQAPLPVGSYLALVLAWPFIEELAFRGLLQGVLHERSWGRRSLCGVSVANLLASAAFVASHLLTRPWLVALPVFLPSLLFGYFRDRYASVWPAFALHAVYNGGFFLVVRGVALN